MRLFALSLSLEPPSGPCAACTLRATLQDSAPRLTFTFPAPLAPPRLLSPLLQVAARVATGPPRTTTPPSGGSASAPKPVNINLRDEGADGESAVMLWVVLSACDARRRRGGPELRPARSRRAR
jgi:hypothetical protein